MSVWRRVDYLNYIVSGITAHDHLQHGSQRFTGFMGKHRLVDIYTYIFMYINLWSLQCFQHDRPFNFQSEKIDYWMYHCESHTTKNLWESSDQEFRGCLYKTGSSLNKVGSGKQKVFCKSVSFFTADFKHELEKSSTSVSANTRFLL